MDILNGLLYQPDAHSLCQQPGQLSPTPIKKLVSCTLSLFFPICSTCNGFSEPNFTSVSATLKACVLDFMALLAGAIDTANKAQGGTCSMGHSFPSVLALATRQVLPHLGCMSLVGLCPPAQSSLHGRPMC